MKNWKENRLNTIAIFTKPPNHPLCGHMDGKGQKENWTTQHLQISNSVANSIQWHYSRRWWNYSVSRLGDTFFLFLQWRDIQWDDIVLFLNGVTLFSSSVRWHYLFFSKLIFHLNDPCQKIDLGWKIVTLPPPLSLSLAYSWTGVNIYLIPLNGGVISYPWTGVYIILSLNRGVYILSLNWG